MISPALISSVGGMAAGALAALVVLRATGYRRNWPWRLGRIHADARSDGGGARLDAADRRPWMQPRATAGGAQPSATQPSGTQVLRALPFTCDLLMVAVSAGHSIHTAIDVVSRLDDSPVGRALAVAWKRFRAGSTLPDELRTLPLVLGEDVRPLVSTLIMGIGSGAPMEPALMRLADGQRRRLRRRTEERVRRLPILLLGPLVVFILPSFVLLTIVPVVLVTAGSSLS